jgi:hypothetical protein
MEKVIIQTSDAPSAVGPYSQGVILDGWLWTSGQVALDPATGKMVGSDAASQANQALRNIDAILRSAGSSLSKVVRTLIQPSTGDFLQRLGFAGKTSLLDPQCAEGQHATARSRRLRRAGVRRPAVARRLALLPPRLHEQAVASTLKNCICCGRVQLGQVAIYCRVSTDDQSCERQERDLRPFAKRAGHKIVGAFKETASGARNDRIERNKVMALARNHKIDAILVTELSRWRRSTQNLALENASRPTFNSRRRRSTFLAFLSDGRYPCWRPSLTPRALAAASPDLTRSRIRSRSNSEASHDCAHQLAARCAQVERQASLHKHDDLPAVEVIKGLERLHAEGLSCWLIARNLELSKNTVMEIVRREAAKAHADSRQIRIKA